MKPAKEIIKGDTIKFGNEWGVAQLDASSSLYCKGEVTVKVITLPGKIRRNGSTIMVCGGVETEWHYRENTKVQVK